MLQNYKLSENLEERFRNYGIFHCKCDLQFRSGYFEWDLYSSPMFHFLLEKNHITTLEIQRSSVLPTLQGNCFILSHLKFHGHQALGWWFDVDVMGNVVKIEKRLRGSEPSRWHDSNSLFAWHTAYSASELDWLYLGLILTCWKFQSLGHWLNSAQSNCGPLRQLLFFSRSARTSERSDPAIQLI